MESPRIKEAIEAAKSLQARLQEAGVDNVSLMDSLILQTLLDLKEKPVTGRTEMDIIHEIATKALTSYESKDLKKALQNDVKEALRN